MTPAPTAPPAQEAPDAHATLAVLAAVRDELQALSVRASHLAALADKAIARAALPPGAPRPAPRLTVGVEREQP